MATFGNTRPDADGSVRARGMKGALVVGYLAACLAVVAAHDAPASGYELSIYTATPLVFWVGIGLALFVATPIALWSTELGRVRDAALLLSVLAAVAVVSLPLLRGYYYFGSGDSLTHLGWMKDIASGALPTSDLLYPGLHAVAVLIHEVVGAPLRRTAYFAVVAFTVCFLVFVPLCVRQLSPRPAATAVGLFAALLLLPINNLSVHLLAHPTTQAITFVPLLLYLLFRYVSTPTGRWLRSPTGGVLAVALVAVVLVHPQQAVAVAAVFASISGLQFLYRRFAPRHAISQHRSAFLPTAFLVAVIAVWAPRHERTGSAATSVLTSLLSDPPTADRIAQRSVSLTQVGGSIEEVFLKLFLASLVFVALAAPLVLVGLRGRFRPLDDDRVALVTYLSGGLLGVGVMFGVYFVASITSQYFRFLGFLMVPVTILGAITLLEGIPRWSGRSLGVPRAVVVVLLVVLLPLAGATTFSSPYIYQGSGHVPAETMDGYETAFETADPTVSFVGVRNGPFRYADAVYGLSTLEEGEIGGLYSGVPASAFNDGLAGYYEEDRYLSITDSTVRVETELYRGFRYSEAGFRALDTTPGIDRVESTGGYRLYLLPGNTTTVGTA